MPKGQQTSHATLCSFQVLTSLHPFDRPHTLHLDGLIWHDESAGGRLFSQLTVQICQKRLAESVDAHNVARRLQCAGYAMRRANAMHRLHKRNSRPPRAIQSGKRLPGSAVWKAEERRAGGEIIGL